MSVETGQESSSENNYPLPSTPTLQNVAKLSIVEFPSTITDKQKAILEDIL